mmetsp:Transcript_2295/g.6460  ORF Transcript_2295/g.6460 Transcript_2295/m.6460 type:complete len:208 (-) Transcript_2295:368-991(-)
MTTTTTTPSITPQPGDRVTEDHGESVVITPYTAERNFGPASTRDSLVYTCERPGGDSKGAKIATQQEVDQWIAFMTSSGRNVRHVIILMEPNELEKGYDDSLIEKYQQGGITVHHIPYSSPQAYAKAMAVLKQVEKANNENTQQQQQQVVAHCTHGMGRSGRVAAGWLVERYGLSPEQAVEEALAAARTTGVERMGAPRQLQEWMAK